ncbi:hypothetical protein TEPIDINF_000256 [Tepidibacillus infernus]|uniref:hypothetical protein n=1 Tax=Tepidibacillus infernus TaxID=1806172 RepID=UPI003B7468A7
MNKFLETILIIFLMIIGISFILFVFRMIWLPPSSMGMMMGRTMMVYHMNLWLRGTFFIFLIFVILFVIAWFIEKNKRDK